MQSTVHLLCWSGSPEVAERAVRAHFPDSQIEVLNQREFRELGWRGQLRVLRKLHGRALVYFFSSVHDNRMPQILAWSGLAHHCKETVLAAVTGEWESYRRSDWLRMLPKLVLSAAWDVFVFAWTWLALHLISGKPVATGDDRRADIDLTYLFPVTLDPIEVGGAKTHIMGFLHGLAEKGGSCEIYSGRQIPIDEFPVTVISGRPRFYLFHELAALRFSWIFAWKMYWVLRRRRPRALYQRHRRYVIASALLSRCLRIPLVLEFNGFEAWAAQQWDPARFPGLLQLAEKFSVASASFVAVVSEVLRDDLIKYGIPSSRIIVNPNGVDPSRFRPGCGGAGIRARLGFQADDVVAGFVGTFSYWHGVQVLQEAILTVLGAAGRDSVLDRLKFLLIGKGPFFEEMRKALQSNPRTSERVVFSGTIPHDQVPSYLDATDILLSPHVPMPDGKPFFGSPTKLFEYMASGKGIVASRLDQIAAVLEDRKSALLITPGSADELVSAMRELVTDQRLRERLGHQARRAVIDGFTWSHNAARVLDRLRPVSQTEALSSDQPSELAQSGFTHAS